MDKKLKKAYAKHLKRVYKDISKKLFLIGVTGTNGKTTTTTLIYKYLKSLNIGVALIGTNGIYINDEYHKTINTTPGIDVIYKVLNKCLHKNIKYVVMEISSHAIDQYRIYGLKFKIRALTNLTEDHLDYHKTMKNYAKTKLSFLKKLFTKSKIILNCDDEMYNYFKLRILKKTIAYGKKDCNFKIKDIITAVNYSKFSLVINDNTYDFTSNLLGEFNVYNLTLFMAAIYNMGLFDYGNINNFLSQKIEIDGRMKMFNKNNNLIIVDYAHTPDGIYNVLKFVQGIEHDNIITVVGCGGNRDKEKRPIMATVATTMSSFVIFTSDNPRFENPKEIITDMIKHLENSNYLIEIDRKKAIERAISMISSNTIVCIFGRGNENSISKMGKEIPFSDIKIVEKLIND